MQQPWTACMLHQARKVAAVLMVVNEYHRPVACPVLVIGNRVTQAGGGEFLVGHRRETTDDGKVAGPANLSGVVINRDQLPVSIGCAPCRSGMRVEEIARFGKRYFPMGQMPAIGPAGDRMIWDQLQLLLDPDSADAMAKASKKRKKDYGGGEYWLPGEIAPGRLPNLRTAIGG